MAVAQVTTDPGIEIRTRKAVGRAHLDANRVEEALRVYADILRDYPEDVESYLFLGDCYLADGDGETAYLFYQQAAGRSPGDMDIARRLDLARQECTTQEPIASDPQSVARWLQKITGRSQPVAEEEVYAAARLLEEIVHSPHPAQIVAQRLNEIDALLPALLELNIRQARADGRPDLALVLQDLLNNIHLQLHAQTGELPAKPLPPLPHEGLPAVERASGCASAPCAAVTHILLLGEPTAALDWQALCATLPLQQMNARVYAALPGESEPAPESFDLVVACNPHNSQSAMEELAASNARKTPIVLYLDADFEQMPLDHPAYEKYGLSTPTRARAYQAALLLADRICVPSPAFAANLVAAGYPAQAVPLGWSQSQAAWGKARAADNMLNLGWVGDAGQIEDLAPLRRIIIRLLREFPQLRLVVAGDPQAYQLFSSLPEARRMYLPSVSREDYPYLLGQIDILMIPLRSTPFNRSLSDRRVVEAGLAGIPWVASPVPAFLDWKAGGLIASTTDEWHTYLRQLVQDRALRQNLGWAGRQVAQQRTVAMAAASWADLFVELL